jgi:hypothetical protein
MSVYFWGVLTAQGLHDLWPCPGIVVPASVAVKLLVVLDERLAQKPFALPGTVTKRPHLGHVYPDKLIHDVQLIEAVDDVQSLVHGLDVEHEIVAGEDGACLEPLGDAGLASAGAAGVSALGDPTESAGSDGVVEIVGREYGLVRVVIAAIVHWCGIGRIRAKAVDASRAS